jgi:thiol-disulfide isomerase/thioredoxin
MKKITAFMMLLSGIVVFGQGIKFENESFKILLDKAKKENKLIFMDAFASWCGPCKKMDKEVFTQEEVGSTYNAAFINTKFDMEKGEGLTIAQKYGVKAFPTYLFIDGNGEVVYRGTGYYEAPEFIKIAKDALDPAKKLSVLREKFKAGAKDPAFLKTVITAYAFSEPELSEKAAVRYFEVKKNQPLEKEDLQILFTLVKSSNSPLYKEIVSRKAELTKLMPEAQYNQILKSFQMSTVMQNAYNKETKILDDKKFMSEASKLMPKSEAAEALLQVKMKMALRAKKTTEYEKLALEYYKDGSDPKFTSDELNSVAWNFFENVTEKSSLLKAITWAEISVKKDEGYANLDTLANLYYKFGDKVNAKLIAEKAIEKAKKEGEDSQSTEELLKKL